MFIDKEKYLAILAELKSRAQLVAVSKTKPAEDIKALYDLGQRDFGENYVQELVDKQAQLPPDIRWHFIGHLQSNKVKYIAPFVHLVHGVDSGRLLKEIDKQAVRFGRRISCLLQVHIAREETKFGLDAAELAELMKVIASGSAEFKNVSVQGLMGMASFLVDQDPEKIRTEFRGLKLLFDQYFGPSTGPTVPNSPTAPSVSNSPTIPAAPPILSMGMSGDYKIAVEEGSNMVRIGSLLFGKRS
jgi:PLP dependent protein